MSFEVWDWRRRNFALYSDVPAERDPQTAHQRGIAGREAMLRDPPASPVPEAIRSAYGGAVVAPYDSAYRFVVPVATDVEPETRMSETATDGVVPFRRI